LIEVNSKEKKVKKEKGIKVFYKKYENLLDLRNSRQTVLNLPSRLSFLTEIGRRFHTAGPRTKKIFAVAASECHVICNARVRDEWRFYDICPEDICPEIHLPLRHLPGGHLPGRHLLGDTFAWMTDEGSKKSRAGQ
jgi:hypothetical protein